MIPKTIHYCWFGGKELPEQAKKCIASWRKFCPDYEIIQWNEQNFDVSANAYTDWCHKNQKWAFLSDYVRLAVVEAHGGIYLDTDVELVRSPDGLLDCEAFIGFENESFLNSGLGFGAEAHHGMVQAMMAEYEAMTPDEQGNYKPTACPGLNTRALVKLGLILDGTEQTVAGARILPTDFLNPYEYTTGRMNKTENTISIHWYDQSWISPVNKLRSALTQPFHRIFGPDCFAWLKK